MRILMLGNSFTFVNDLPGLLAKRLGAEVIHHTRGGARLSEQLNPVTRMGALTQKALKEEKWDYVILQEMSNAPIKNRKSFRKNIGALNEQIRAAGGIPILYATWAYNDGSVPLEKMEMSYEEMEEKMYESYHQVAERYDIPVADVGRAFMQERKRINLYHDDGSHPSMEGSQLAAEILAQVIVEEEKKKLS